MNNRRRGLMVMFVAAVCLGLRVRALEAQQAPARGGNAADRPAEPRAVAEEQLALARRALGIIDQATQRGIPALRQPQEVYVWSRRLVEAQLYLSFEPDEPKTMSPEVYLSLFQVKPKPERAAAFEVHWKRMQLWEDRLRSLIARGAMSPLDFTEVEAHRIEAESWLAREKARAQANNK
jgi:hypothetical protein